MPRKELGAPSEDRKRAERLFDEDPAGVVKKRNVTRNVDYGCDETELSEAEGGVALIKEKKKKSAREYAMTLVSIKSYTEHALREKLKIRAYGCDEIEEAVAYVKGFGYINDLRLAQNAAEKLASRLYGKRKIFAYLRQKGISGEVIDGLDLSEIDFRENARECAEKLMMKGKTKEQTIRSLVSLGFSASDISYAINTDFDIDIGED